MLPSVVENTSKPDFEAPVRADARPKPGVEDVGKPLAEVDLVH